MNYDYALQRKIETLLGYVAIGESYNKLCRKLLNYITTIYAYVLIQSCRIIT